MALDDTVAPSLPCDEIETVLEVLLDRWKATRTEVAGFGTGRHSQGSQTDSVQ